MTESTTAPAEASASKTESANKPQKEPKAKAAKGSKATNGNKKQKDPIESKPEMFHGLELTTGDNSDKGGTAKKPLASWIARNRIHVIPDFNPRGALGDYSELVTNMKKNGFGSAIITRPQKGKDGHFELIAGERRYKAAGEAGIEELLCVIRNDLVGDDEMALAVAVAENSEDSRVPLTAVEVGSACAKLEKKGWEIAKIAAHTGYHTAKVRRCIGLVKAPDDVKKLIKDGMGMVPALELAQVPDDIRKKLRDKINTDTSKTEIQRLAKEVARESADAKAEKSVGVGKAANRKKGSSRAAAVKVWKGNRDKTAQMEEIAHLIVSTPEADKQSAEYFEFRGALAYALWDAGELEEPFLPDVSTDKASEKKTLGLFDSLVASFCEKYKVNHPEGK